MAAIKFEKALSRLETIVTELEAGELSLDDSLKIFEEGVKLSKTCLKMLVRVVSENRETGKTSHISRLRLFE